MAGKQTMAGIGQEEMRGGVLEHKENVDRAHGEVDRKYKTFWRPLEAKKCPRGNTSIKLIK